MVFIPSGPLRRFVGFQRTMQVEGCTIGQGLDAVCRDFPELRQVLFDASGEVRAVHRLALNSAVLHGSQLDMPVAARDKVEVVTALAGG
jgi:molybdopterin converting factor small subunit